MDITMLLKKSLADFTLAQAALKGGAEITDTLVSIVGRWYSNVELPYPIPDMELEDDASRGLSVDIIDEMVAAITAAVPLAERDPEEFTENALPEVSATVDALWLEFARANAKVLNDAYAEQIADMDPEETQEMLSEAFEALSEATGMPLDVVREQALQDPFLRNGLRSMGIDPDAI